MKAKLHCIWAVGIAMAMFTGISVAANPLAETATAKAAAAKACADKVSAANTAAREAVATRAAAARAVSDASSKVTAAKKTLSVRSAAAKAAADKAAASKSDADKAAAERAAAEKKAAENAVKDKDAELAAAKEAQADKDAASKDAAEKYKALRRASYPIVAEKTAAEKAVAEKVAADRAAAAKAAAGKASAAASALKKAEAARVAAEKGCKDCVAKAAAAKKGTAGKAGDAKTAAEKAAKAADTKATAAKKALAEKAAAVKTAAAAAKATKAAAEKAAAAKTAAEKDLSAKTSADKVAGETVNASNLFVALTALDDAMKERAAAEKALASKVNLESKSKSLCAAAKKAADKAAAGKDASAKPLAAKAAALKAAADKASAGTRTARNVLAEISESITAAQEKEAAARAIALGGLKPMPSSAWNHAKARHLMVRAGFGGTPVEVQELYEMGLHDAVNHFVEIYDQPVANVEFDPARLRRPEPWVSRLDSVERQYMTVKHRNPERRQQTEMRRWWLKRMAESPRPLQEKMTLFWHDHFAVQYKKRYRTYMLYQQNQLFRTYGTDNFGALLRGIVHDPAMISYLDNNVNYKGSGNENLGREILELFSIGEGRGYSEEDLREASRALTGYTYDSWTEQFRFLATRHDEEPKKILGSKGNWGGDDLVDIILRQSATAGYVTGKLFAFLAYEEPEDETIEKLANVMRVCSYDLRPMLKNLFLSEEFYSDKAMGTHIKGPVELTIGAIRDLGIQESVNYASVDSAVNQMGQYLFEPPNVAGWNENRTWINAERILVRYNQMAKLVEQPNVDVVAVLGGEGLDTPQKVVDELAKACLVVTPDAEKSKALAEYLGELPPPAEWEAKRDQINAKLRAILVLLMSTPESQLG